MQLIAPQDKYRTSFLKALGELPQEEKWRLIKIESQVPQSIFLACR